MINRDALLTQFCLLSGLSKEEGQPYLPLVEAAAAELERRLRPESDAADPRLCYAAAALAYYRYSLMESSGSGFSFRAGDVSVSQNGRALLQSAAALRDDALAGAVDLIQDTEFLMRTV